MLLVKTYIAPSKINGTGLYSKDFIKKGTCIWEFNPKFDRVIKKDEINEYLKECSPIIKDWLKHYAYYEKDGNKYILCMDDAKFTNHSDTPNSDEIDKNRTMAFMNIYPGEEITSNYYEFDDEAELKLNGKLEKIVTQNGM